MAKTRQSQASAGSGKTGRKARTRKTKASMRAGYLKKLNLAVRGQFAEATDLPTFLSSAGGLAVEQRKQIVEQALVLIEQNFVHLPLKRAMHAVDPVQRLRLLQRQLEQVPAAEQPSEMGFHREMTEIFTSVRDLHTNYLLPAPFNSMVAFLPFMIEDYVLDGKRRYLVSHIAEGFSHPTFVKGVEITHWNGAPIERAALANAQRFAGSNLEARHARGVQTLTTRALRLALPPDEEWVIVGYLTADGQAEEIRVDWMVNPPLPAGEGGDSEGSLQQAASLGVDLEQEIIQRTRKVLFAPRVVAAEKKAAAKKAKGTGFGDQESSLPQIFEARPVTTPHGTFGYLRIRTFSHWPVEEFVGEFVRLVSSLPQEGLILDVRGNGGGVILNGEMILQVLTPRRIEPEPVQFVNTPLNLALCRRHGATSPIVDLSPWVESIEQSLQTGAVYSSGFPISPADECNAIGQRYFGPVALITDALCYSTTDIFAAGFQDHEIGPVLGADGNTGAGGANVWTHTLLRQLMPGSASPYQPLPNQADMRVAIRRSLRVGRRTGTPVEDLGVIPDHRHFMTREDLLNGNVDLINQAGRLLAAMPVRSLQVQVADGAPGQADVKVAAQGISRLDVYVNGRPSSSLDVQEGQSAFSVPRPLPGPAGLEIQGFDDSQLVARYRVEV